MKEREGSMSKVKATITFEGGELYAIDDDGRVTLWAPGGRVKDFDMERPKRWWRVAPWLFGSGMVLWLVLAITAVISRAYAQAAWCGSMACLNAVFLCNCD